MHSLLPRARITVSSVLNRDVKQFGKQHLTDEDEQTCWNSDQGEGQYIGVRLAAPAQPHLLLLQFQGGFAGADCWVEAGEAPDRLERLHAFHPEDKSGPQTFSVTCPRAVTHLRVVFGASTDLFGRVVVYKLDVLSDEPLPADQS